MPNMTAFTDVLTYTVDSFSSENSQFPASNVLTYENQFDFWKTTVTTDSWIIVDLGSAKVIDSVVLVNTNAPVYRIEGDTTNSFASPPFNSGAINVKQDLITRRFSSIKNPQDFASFNLQFIRIFIPSGTPLDGASEFSLGGLVITDQAENLLTNPNWGLRIERDQVITETKLLGGGLQTVQRGQPAAVLNFDIQRERKIADFIQLTKHFFKIGRNTSLIFSPSSEMVEDTSDGQYVYVMKQMTNPNYTIPNPVVANMRGVILRELI